VVGARFTFGNALLVVVIAMVGYRHRHPRRHEQGVKSSVLHHLLDTLLSILPAAGHHRGGHPGAGSVQHPDRHHAGVDTAFIRATYNAVHAEMQKEYIIASRSTALRIMRLAICRTSSRPW
jgi:cationic peptide transport system permease protein